MKCYYDECECCYAECLKDKIHNCVFYPECLRRLSDIMVRVVMPTVMAPSLANWALRCKSIFCVINTFMELAGKFVHQCQTLSN